MYNIEFKDLSAQEVQWLHSQLLRPMPIQEHLAGKLLQQCTAQDAARKLKEEADQRAQAPQEHAGP